MSDQSLLTEVIDRYAALCAELTGELEVLLQTVSGLYAERDAMAIVLDAAIGELIDGYIYDDEDDAGA